MAGAATTTMTNILCPALPTGIFNCPMEPVNEDQCKVDSDCGNTEICCPQQCKGRQCVSLQQGKRYVFLFPLNLFFLLSHR